MRWKGRMARGWAYLKLTPWEGCPDERRLNPFCISAILGIVNHVEGTAMEAKKKRLTLDLDAPVQRRLKAVAALKGVSMRRYCLTAIDRELAKDEATGALFRSFNIDGLVALQKEAFGDQILPGDGAEFIREARESRSIS